MKIQEFMRETLKNYTTKLKGIFVSINELSDVAKSGDYADLKNKPNVVSKNGDRMTGALNVYNGGSDATHTSINTTGNIMAGTNIKTAYSMVGTIRKCINDNNRLNTSVFFTNSDGTTKFCHKAGESNGTDDAYMLLGPEGFIVAYSGKYGEKPTEDQVYELRHSGNCYSKEEIDAMFAQLKGGI